MKLIHMQSTLTVVFGLLDEDGDVAQQIPLELPIAKLDEKSLGAALHEVRKKRADIESKIPIAGKAASGEETAEAKKEA
jgi:hypothetical protein